MTLLEQLNEFYFVMNTPQNSFYVLIGFLIIALAAIILRIIVCIGYQTQLTLFHLNAKEIKNRSEVKDTRSSFLNRIIKDYLRIGDKGVSPRSAKNVVDRHINRLNFIGLGYDGIAAFTMAMERNIVFLGIILIVVFDEYRYVFAICTVVAFFVMRLFAAVFDFASVKARLSLEVSEYVDREIGQFYAGDSGSLILRLKNELAAAILRQSETIGDGIKKMGADISGVLHLSMQEMSKSIDSTMMRVSDFGGELSVPLENWKKAVNDTAQAQNVFGSALTNFQGVSKELKAAAHELSGGLGVYTESIHSHSGIIKDEIAQLSQIADGLKTTSEPMFKISDGINTQLGYIERNQELLEHSLQRYELTMEDMARKLGDGMGSIIEFHAQSAYTSLNESLEDNIKRIVTANNELVNRMQELVMQIHEQSRSESQAVLKIKEQMDLHFESLNK